MTDHLALYCLPFLFVTIIAFCIVFYLQFCRLDNEINRLIVLVTRLSLFLPLYGILIYISLVVPVLYEALEIPTALIEGYSFYTFFVLMVTNMGGPKQTVSYLQESNKPLLFHSCCPSNKRDFYIKATYHVFHFLCTRVFIVALSTICSYVAEAKNSRAARLIGVLFSLVALLLLIRGVASVVNLYEDVYSHLTNLKGVLKVFLLKISVGLITIQGIVASCLVQFGGNPYSENSQYSAEYRLQRYYCALVLAEFTALSFVFLFAYGSAISVPNTPYVKILPTGDAPAAASGTDNRKKPSVCSFLCQVLSFTDVFGVIRLGAFEIVDQPAPPTAESP